MPAALHLQDCNSFTPRTNPSWVQVHFTLPSEKKSGKIIAIIANLIAVLFGSGSCYDKPSSFIRRFRRIMLFDRA